MGTKWRTGVNVCVRILWDGGWGGPGMEKGGPRWPARWGTKGEVVGCWNARLDHRACTGCKPVPPRAQFEDLGHLKHRLQAGAILELERTLVRRDRVGELLLHVGVEGLLGVEVVPDGLAGGLEVVLEPGLKLADAADRD